MASHTRSKNGPAWLATGSGKKFYPLDPRAEDVGIEDIAHGLAYKYRFAGQAVCGYTVAQHSIEVSRRVPPADRLWGLLHDAAEAYLCDVPRPIKAAMSLAVPMSDGSGDYHAIVPFEVVEREILAVVAERFGLPWPLPESVRVADDRELARERRDLWDERQPQWPASDLPEPYPERIEWCRAPEDIEKLFMARFRDCLVNK